MRSRSDRRGRSRAVPLLRACILGLMAIVAVCPTGAQNAAPVSGAARTTVDQIVATTPSAPGQDDVTQLAVTTDARGTTPQLAHSGRSATPPVAQLATDTKTASAVPQIYRGERTAAASAPLSSSVEGKPQPVARLSGHDACDPARGDSAKNAECSNAIETRSDEFAREAPTTLTPEQKLLIDQRQLEGINDPAAAVRRIGRNEVDANDSASQGVASLILPPQPTAPTKEDQDQQTPDQTTIEQAATTIAQAIIQGGQ